MKRHPTGYLVKLVRDRVALVLGESGTVTYRPMSREQHVECLRAKLVEEAVEYLMKPSLRELAHVLAVAEALAEIDLGTTLGALHGEAVAEQRERGGFRDGIGMYATHPWDHE
jgi:predicted house-cleaning noncanonical NTP pyrophosphatase (MazG superfamily)